MSDSWAVSGKTDPTDGTGALKVVWTDGEVVDRCERPTSKWSLTKFYTWGRDEGLFGPKSHQVKLKAVTRFDALLKSPPLGRIDKAQLQKWVGAMEAQAGRDGDLMAPRTIDKEWRAIRSVLREARGYKCCRMPQRPKLPALDEPLPREVELAEMKRLYDAAQHMTWPRPPGVRTVDWWRGLLVYAWNTGTRPEHWRGLQWSHVDLEAGEVHASRAIDKVKKRRWFALNEVTRAHLRRIRPEAAEVKRAIELRPDAAEDLRKASQLVFPLIDCRKGRLQDRTQFYRGWRKLLKLAGFEEGSIVCKNVRQTVGTTLRDLAGEDVAIETLGHSSQIFRTHYDARKRQRRREAADAMPQFADPR